jgi:calcium/calmodulin-dependent protein kinase I
MSPQICNGESCGKSVNLWACAFVGYVMLSGKFPFDTGETFVPQMPDGVKFRDKEWRDVSRAAKLLLRGLLGPNQETLLTAQQALAHHLTKRQTTHNVVTPTKCLTTTMAWTKNL